MRAQEEDAAEEKLLAAQTTRDEVLQRIGGVEARSERNDSRIDSLKVLLAKSKEEIFGQADDQTLDEDELDKAEQRLQELFEEIEGEFGAPLQNRMRSKMPRNASHALEGKIDKLESVWISYEIKRCSNARFIADARNQAFRDELSLDLEEGYNNSTFDSFDGVELIEEEDLAKNRERFEELLRFRFRRSLGLAKPWNHIVTLENASMN